MRQVVGLEREVLDGACGAGVFEAGEGEVVVGAGGGGGGEGGEGGVEGGEMEGGGEGGEGGSEGGGAEVVEGAGR